jgi:hypothetical protein
MLARALLRLYVVCLYADIESRHLGVATNVGTGCKHTYTHHAQELYVSAGSC